MKLFSILLGLLMLSSVVGAEEVSCDNFERVTGTFKHKKVKSLSFYWAKNKTDQAFVHGISKSKINGTTCFSHYKFPLTELEQRKRWAVDQYSILAYGQRRGFFKPFENTIELFRSPIPKVIFPITLVLDVVLLVPGNIVVGGAIAYKSIRKAVKTSRFRRTLKKKKKKIKIDRFAWSLMTAEYNWN